MTLSNSETTDEIARLREAVHQDGIAGVPGAFSRAWGEQLLEDFETLFAQARSRHDGTVNRGTNRFYFTVHPERLRGFVELLTPELQPLVQAHTIEGLVMGD